MYFKTLTYTIVDCSGATYQNGTGKCVLIQSIKDYYTSCNFKRNGSLSVVLKKNQVSQFHFCGWLIMLAKKQVAFG